MLYRVVIFRHTDQTEMYTSKWTSDFNQADKWSSDLLDIAKPGEVYAIIEEEKEECDSEDETLG